MRGVDSFMSSKYSKLSIDRTKIPNWLQMWCEQNLKGKFNITCKDIKARIQYSIDNEGNVIKIDFIKNKDGLFTICPNVGSNVSISTQIAESIYSRVCNVLKDSPFANGFSIILQEDDFNTVIDLISAINGVKCLGSSEQMEEGHAKYKLFRYSGEAGDTVTLKYYPNTSRMQLQGKPLYLFNEIVAMVSENGAKQDDVVDAHLKYCNVGMSKEEVFEELENILGNGLYMFLGVSHRVILSTSLILSKVDGYLGDYSIIIQPANRAYEGFMKKIYAQKGLMCEGEHQLGMFFDWPDAVSPVMKPKYSSNLDSNIEKGFTSMFKFYSMYRHPYMHANAYDITTTIIEKREVADEKLKEIIDSMKTWYEWYKSIK